MEVNNCYIVIRKNKLSIYQNKTCANQTSFKNSLHNKHTSTTPESNKLGIRAT